MSILNSIRSIYNELCGQAQTSSNLLSLLMNDGYSENIIGSITDDTTNSIITIDYDHNASDVFLGLYQGEQCLVQPSRYEIGPSAWSIGDAINNLLYDGNLNQELYFEDIVENVAQNCDANTMFAEVTQSFMTSVRQDANVIIALINSKPTISIEDKEKLVSMIQSQQKDGSVTQYSWLSIMSTIFGATKDKADTVSSLQPVTGSPYVLRGIWQLVTTLIKTAISAILDVISLLCAGIIRLIALVVKAAATLLSSVAGSDIKVIDDDNTDYVQGSNMLINRSINTTVAIALNSLQFYELGNNAIVSTSPGIETYFWENKTGGFTINGRLILNVHPGRLKAYILNRASVVYTHGNTEYKITLSEPLWPISFANDAENFYLTEQESLSLKYDIDFADSVMMASLAAMGLVFFKTTGSVQFKTWGVNPPDPNYYDLAALCAFYGALTDPFSFKNSNSSALYKKFWNAILYYSEHTVITDWDDAYTINVTAANPPGTYYSTNEQYGYEMITEFIQEILGCYVQYNVSTQVLSFVFNSTYDRGLLHTVVDSIPTGYSFIPSQFSIDQIVTAVTTVALMITSVFVAGKIITKAINNRLRISQLNRTQGIGNLRQIYINDPSKENARALNKSINRYNRLGSIFGWDTYDLTNNWYNPRSTIKNAEMANLLAGGRVDETSIDVLNNNINLVKTLIKGN